MKLAVKYGITALNRYMDLLHAAESGCLSRVKQLVAADKSLMKTCRHTDAKNRAFNRLGSPIHYACRSGHLNVARYLLEQDPTIIKDIDEEVWTPLHYACYNGHLRIVQLLLEYNADVHVKDSYLSQTPIQFAMYRQFEDVVRLLDPTVEWRRRTADEIARKGDAPVFRKKSNLYLGRYRINEEQIKQIGAFRNDPQATPIELQAVEDLELNHRRVRIRLNHDFHEHAKQTADLLSIDDDDGFLRSSTSSTNEHLLVFADQWTISNNLVLTSYGHSNRIRYFFEDYLHQTFVCLSLIDVENFILIQRLSSPNKERVFLDQQWPSYAWGRERSNWI